MTDRMPRDIPVIFSSPMVRALLDGRKTMTRRLAWSFVRRKLARDLTSGNPCLVDDKGRTTAPSPWQKAEPGDRLWVRESLYADQMEDLLTGERTTNVMAAYYVADKSEVLGEGDFNLAWKWERKSLPSIHMPRAFSRLTLVVTSTKIERLQDISEADAKAEGWTPRPEVSADPEVHRDAARDWFSDLWTDLHGVESWRSNPEVVALSFKVVRQNIDRIAA